ncbi:hypothetical protein [Micromonospora sp. NPDC049679]|uniref:hypothetical protein n=1 Tax=Micromonospora sp. NPDC049679 TaxID=3155920 RepID=UPI0033F8CD11
MTRPLASSIVVGVATALTAAFVLFGATSPARIPVVLAFSLVVPGLGWARRLRLSDAGDTVLAAVTISICLLVVVGEGMALLRLWSVPGGFLLLAAVALLGVVPPRGRTDLHGHPGRSGPRSWWPGRHPARHSRQRAAGRTVM